MKHILTIAILIGALMVNASAQEPTKQEIRDARKAGEALPSSVRTITTSAQGQYNLLLQDKDRLNTEIYQLNSKIAVEKKSKQKKLQKTLDSKNSELEVVNRRMESFPESVRNPQSAEKTQDKEFLDMLEKNAQKKIQMTDPYSGTISNDPALEQSYRKHLNNNGYIPLYDSQSGECITSESDNSLKYRIMLTIERSALPASSFNGMDSVLEQRMADGTIIYYQGSYSTEGEAQRACANIIKQNKFRDAFVVAMMGARRVEL
ncbi:MAG: hypothetical protein R3Y49_06625 [Rikenellaceae bacterium]